MILIFQLASESPQSPSDIPGIHQPIPEICVLFSLQNYHSLLQKAGNCGPLLFISFWLWVEPCACEVSTLPLTSIISACSLELGYMAQAALEFTILLRAGITGVYYYVQCFGHFSGPHLGEISRAVQN